MNKIYTKTGDKGQTSSYDNKRIGKNNIRVESYGTIDELNSFLGLSRNFIEDEEIKDIILKIQEELFLVAGQLATVDEEKFQYKITDTHVKRLEEIIDLYIKKSDKVNKFIVPGTNKASGFLHVSRTICRRAERRIISLSETEEISPTLLKYVNRLSDTIYSIGRYLENEKNYVDFKKSSI
ncbi:cob(I)yrinic acid a,c-diamide adenosyltransferase [Anaeromicrobium sediminis]|uniref:Corrinoid adenosyltransferase n=1 Tax=Anaeromicrobium sediminis TaxID=1478221 RepID=A0A267MI61_9FIRM|nr:cob(I)yrinic acid a,c-diamide adenosyltransferase [Anaeromicrobium sediminis]PAB59216.1 ATP:cob(I)alamin adenosyltransferase [Anaeromicrobium sediminis]